MRAAQTNLNVGSVLLCFIFSYLSALLKNAFNNFLLGIISITPCTPNMLEKPLLHIHVNYCNRLFNAAL